jgi:ribosomal protein S18 acetylase RimI-like enzyme
MVSQEFSIELSPLDTSRFGVTSARAFLSHPDHYEVAVDFCNKNNVSFLIARCPVTSLPLAQIAEKSGSLLMDTLCYYAFHADKKTLPPIDSNVIIRPLAVGEEACVERIAAESFLNYSGHYHADNRLDKKSCDEVYSSWASNACLMRDASHAVLVAEINRKIVGFITVQSAGGEGETILSGVSSDAQRQGVYRALMIGGVKWCLEKNITIIRTSTQLSNMAVQRVWVRLGFEPDVAYYTFHKWFD